MGTPLQHSYSEPVTFTAVAIDEEGEANRYFITRALDRPKSDREWVANIHLNGGFTFDQQRAIMRQIEIALTTPPPPTAYQRLRRAAENVLWKLSHNEKSRDYEGPGRITRNDVTVRELRAAVEATE